MTWTKARHGLVTIATVVLANCAVAGYAQTTFTVPVAATSSQVTPYYTNLNSVQAVAVDNQGNIFATLPQGPSGSDASGELIEFPAGSASYTVLLGESYGMSYPKGVAVDNLGNVFVTDYGGNLWKVPLGGGTPTNISPACASLDGGYLGTQEVAADGQGNVYTSGNNEAAIFKITPSGTCSTPIYSALTGGNVPSHIAVDPAGNITYSIGDDLYTLPVGTSTPVQVLGGFQAEINGLGADRFGNIFINDQYFIDEVPFVNGALNGYQFAFILPATSANDIGIDYLGRVYTTDGGSITVSTPGNVALGSTAVGTTSATQTFTMMFNQTVTLTGIQFLSDGVTSTEAVNTGGGSCATGAPGYSSGNRCTVTFTYTPSAVGQRSVALVLSDSNGIVGVGYIGSVGVGAELAIDPATTPTGPTSTIGSTLNPAGVGIDLNGNYYISDATTGNIYKSVAAGAPTVFSTTALSSPAQIAVSSGGTVYVADTGNNRIAALTTGGVVSSFLTTSGGTALSGPTGVAVDGYGNVYIADTGNNRVLKYVEADQETYTLYFSGLNGPKGLAVDAAGDVYVADTGNARIEELTSSVVQSTVIGSLATPIGVALDAAGDVLVADSGAKTVTIVPVGTSLGRTILGGVSNLTGLAADSVGDLFYTTSSGSSVGGLSLLSRSQVPYAYASTPVGASTTQAFTLTDSGNATLTIGASLGSNTDSTDFALASAAANGCSVSGTVVSGSNCGLAAVFQPQSVALLADTVSFPTYNPVNTASLTLTGTGTTIPTTTTLSTGTITYGQSVSVVTTVAPATGSSTPTGTVTLTTDGGGTLNGTLSNGQYTFTVTGLQAGSHYFTATYSPTGNYAASSTSSNTYLTVNQAILTVTGACANRIFGQVNSCGAPGITGYQYTDSASAVFAGTPASTTTAVRDSVAGTYIATPVTSSLALTAFGSTNYTVSQANGTFVISGGASQFILFTQLPNFTHGNSYQLTARTSSGLPVTYTVTTGNSIASISGDVLTVSGTGTVTVQAAQSTDPTGDYAPATPVSVTFTAQ